METTTVEISPPTDFGDRIEALSERVERCLEAALPAASVAPARLHDAMRYAVLSGGKRIRPLLVYASGQCLGIDVAKLDVPATAIELIHAFSLVHDDLPSMDDDDLRRGKPTVHRKFDEATAILAADALQPLAFQVIAMSDRLDAAEIARLVRLIAGAAGSLGMTGGQAIDLASQGRILSPRDLANMHSLKTGALIRACILAPTCLSPGAGSQAVAALDRFANDVGLAFQVRDDILDVAGETAVIGKPAGSDAANGKATWPAIFGLDASRQRCNELLESAMDQLASFGDSGDPLRQIARYIVEREW